MPTASAFDPSSWADDDSEATPTGPLDDAPADGVGPRAPIEDLYAELDDLRELERSTQAQLDKAFTVVESAEVELPRLRERISVVESEIETYDDDASATEDAQDGA